MRQQTLSLKRKERWMPNLRQQTYTQFSQSEAFLRLGLFDKTNLQIVPEMYFKCTSGLQAIHCHLQVEFTIRIYKLIFQSVVVLL
jgi:hypothetical protein